MHVFCDDRGQGLAEYGLVLAFIAALCVVAVAVIGNELSADYQSISAGYP